MTMRKRILLLMMAFISAVGWARVPTQAEVTEVAQDIVTRDSFQGIMADRTVESVSWVELEDDYGVWTVALAPGGHLVLGTSTKYRAMISWGNEAFAIPDRASPQYALLLRAAQRAVAAEAGDGADHPSWNISGASFLALTAIPEDSIVHQPVDTTNWAQDGVMAWYVPGNAPCGCVATATAQIMRALEWPVYAEGFFEADLNYTPSGGTTTTENYAFSPYSKIDYSIMHDVLADYQSNLLNNHQVARLVLLNDILARMNFADGGSGAVTSWAATTPWTINPNSRKLDTNNGKISYTDEDIAYIEEAMAWGLPIACSIPGHAIVASGYALYDSEPYVRLNYGWGGSSSGWYHVDDVSEYAIVYPTRTVQCDPLTGRSSATPTISWHLPTCYDNKVESFTITATKIPETTGETKNWSDSFTSLSGEVTGNTHSLRVSYNELQVLLPDTTNSAPKILYTWDEIFVPTADSKLDFSYHYYYARGPVSLQVLPLGDVWQTIWEIDPGLDASVDVWQSASLDLSDYTGVPCKFRLYVHPTVYDNYFYYNYAAFSMKNLSISSLAHIITTPTETFTASGAETRSYTFAAGALTPGAHYAFSVTPNFTDAATKGAGTPSMPCYTQIVDDTTSVEPTTTITCTSTSAEAHDLSSMLFVDNMRRYCTYFGYSLIHVETSPAATALELHSSHPTAYPDEAFRIEELGNGAFDIVIDSSRMPQSPRENDCLNLSVIAVSETGARTAQELSLIFTNSNFAVSETIPTYGVDHPTELYAVVNDGEQTLDSLVWTDLEGTEYAESEIEWFYVSTVNIAVNRGTLTLDGSRSLSGILMIDPDATVKLTTAAALGDLTVYGSGTLECAGVFPTKRGGLTNATWWRGTVELTGEVVLKDIATSLEVLGHSESKLRVTGTVTGYLAKNTDCNIPLELNGSITLTDGYGGTSYTFAKLSGSGSFGNDRNKNSEITYTIVFSDASDFTGSLNINSRNTATRFVIGNLNDAGNGAIVVSSDKTATLGSTASWSAPGGVTVKGTIGGSGTIGSNLTFVSGSKLDATQGVLTVTGSVSAANVPVVVDENCYGRILTAANLAANSFTLTETTALLLIDATGLIYTTRPSLIVANTETVSSAAANSIAQTANNVGIYKFTLDPTSGHPDGVELFEDVISVEPGSDVVKIDYDFGIQSVTVQNLTDGLHVVLAVAVMRDGAAADYAEGTQVKVLLNGAEVATAEVIDDSVPGVMKIAVPYSELENTQSPSDTFTFTVKAVND